MFRSLEELSHQIHRFGLEAIEDKLIAFARPSVLMERTRMDEDLIPIGASKLGGNPDLPEGFEWPYYEDRPFSFIGQFKLSEVASASRQKLEAAFPHQLTLWDMDTIPSIRPDHVEERLPEHGILYFFYDEFPDFSRRESGRVFYVEDEDIKLYRTAHPSYTVVNTNFPQFPRFVRALPAHKLTFIQSWTLPQSLKPYQGSVFSAELMDAYWEMLYDDLPSQMHYFYGYAMPIQGEVELDCIFDTQIIKRNNGQSIYSNGQLVNMDEEIEKWQFLFQIDTDDSLGVMWGDMGRLYVCIPKTSLQKRRFEDCWTIMQCS